MSTTTTKVNPFKLGSEALLALAMERTDKNHLTANAKRARAEIERRDAKHAAKLAKLAPPVAALIVTPDDPTLVTDEDIDALVAQARKVALSIAQSMAASEALAKGGGYVKALIKARREMLAQVDADHTPFLV